MNRFNIIIFFILLLIVIIILTKTEKSSGTVVPDDLIGFWDKIDLESGEPRYPGPISDRAIEITKENDNLYKSHMLGDDQNMLQEPSRYYCYNYNSSENIDGNQGRELDTFNYDGNSTQLLFIKN